MQIEEKVENTLKQNCEIAKNDDFKNLHRFYEQMKDAGVIVKKEYNLPPLDSIGRQLHQTLVKVQRKQR